MDVSSSSPAIYNNGSLLTPPSTTSGQAGLLSLMEDTLLAQPDNSAYITALEKCPELLGKESSLYRFLHYSGNDPEAAAKRLLAYWNLRLETFGNRCYRPIVDFSGNGALEEDYLKTLDNDVCYLLPPNREKKMVLFADYSNNADASLEHGAIYIRLVRDKRQSFSPAVVHYFKRATQVFPVTMEAFHFVVAPHDLPEKKRGQFVNKVIPYMWQLLKENYNFTRRTMDFLPVEAEKESQRAEIAKFLVERYGLLPWALPVAAGGTWSYKRMKRLLSSPHGFIAYSDTVPSLSCDGAPPRISPSSSSSAVTSADSAPNFAVLSSGSAAAAAVPRTIDEMTREGYLFYPSISQNGSTLQSMFFGNPDTLA